MSVSSSSTWPSAKALGTSSCIRFRQRMKIDLPQPDGPMIAVTSFAMMSKSMPLRTFDSPYPATRFFARILTFPGDESSSRECGAFNWEEIVIGVTSPGEIRDVAEDDYAG